MSYMHFHQNLMRNPKKELSIQIEHLKIFIKGSAIVSHYEICRNLLIFSPKKKITETKTCQTVFILIVVLSYGMTDMEYYFGGVLRKITAHYFFLSMFQ